MTQFQEEGQGFVSTLDKIAEKKAHASFIQALHEGVAGYMAWHSDLKVDHGRVIDMSISGLMGFMLKYA
jgi:hypothetical protein